MSDRDPLFILPSCPTSVRQMSDIDPHWLAFVTHTIHADYQSSVRQSDMSDMFLLAGKFGASLTRTPRPRA
jgi:hypothetical protein